MLLTAQVGGAAVKTNFLPLDITIVYRHSSERYPGSVQEKDCSIWCFNIASPSIHLFHVLVVMLLKALSAWPCAAHTALEHFFSSIGKVRQRKLSLYSYKTAFIIQKINYYT